MKEICLSQRNSFGPCRQMIKILFIHMSDHGIYKYANFLYWNM